jgi:carbon-monoxide dehydrogenase medium subunit
VIPVAFDYERAATVDEALGLLAEHGDEAKLIAGGHSLLPLMKLRLATPAVLIDIAGLSDLTYIREEGDEIAIGALTRHHAVNTSELLAREVPLLAHAAGQVGDPQVRHRGTIGGSLVHGDPASDLPAVLLALKARVIVTGPTGERSVAASDLFTGFLETAVGEDEVLTEVRVPRLAGLGWSFQKFTQRACDWAIVGVAAQAGEPGGGRRAGVALVNMGATPLQAIAVEGALDGGADTAEAAALAAEGTEAPGDLNASPEFREHLARVLVRRALDETASR